VTQPLLLLAVLNSLSFDLSDLVLFGADLVLIWCCSVLIWC